MTALIATLMLSGPVLAATAAAGLILNRIWDPQDLSRIGLVNRRLHDLTALPPRIVALSEDRHEWLKTAPFLLDFPKSSSV